MMKKCKDEAECFLFGKAGKVILMKTFQDHWIILSVEVKTGVFLEN